MSVPANLLPTELYEKIASYLARSELASLARASRFTHAIAFTRLHHEVVVVRSTPAQVVLDLLESLNRQPNLAKVVRKLDLDWTNAHVSRSVQDSIGIRLATTLSDVLSSTVHLEYLAISRALRSPLHWDVWQGNGAVPFLTRLREVHIYSTSWELSTGLETFISRLKRLRQLMLFPSLNRGIAQSIASVQQLDVLRLQSVDELMVVLGSGHTLRHIRRIDIASSADQQIRSILRVYSSLPDVQQLNFIRHIRFYSLVRTTSIAAQWLSMRRLGLYYCPAGQNLLEPHVQEMVAFSGRAFPHLEYLDLYCVCGDKDHFFTSSVIHIRIITSALLDIVRPWLGLRQLTFAGRAYLRGVDRELEFTSEKLDSIHEVPDIPFHQLE